MRRYDTDISAVVPPTTVTSNAACKCVTMKYGTRSCCARDGDWFRNCGTALDHSLSEGIQACESKFVWPVNNISTDCMLATCHCQLDYVENDKMDVSFQVVVSRRGSLHTRALVIQRRFVST